MKRFYNINFSNIVVESTECGKNGAFVITGMPEHPIEGLTFSDIKAVFTGGGTADDAKTVLAEFTPENLGARWPETSMFRGNIPAHGFYARHVKGITLRNIEFTTQNADARPAIVFVDVTDAKISDCSEPDKR